MVVHDIPRIPVQGDIIKQHKLVPKSTLSNGLPGRTWRLVFYNSMTLLSPVALGGVGAGKEIQGTRTPSPAGATLCVGPNPEALVDCYGQCCGQGTTRTGSGIHL